MGRIDLSKYNIRTDLIIEHDDIVHDNLDIDGIIVSRTLNNGNYITISFSDITNFEDREKVGKCLEENILEMLRVNHIKDSDSCLVIGLGNALSTPDSLGVKVLSNIVVTAHLAEFNKLSDGMRIVYGFSPSVKGNTGIESYRIIMSLVKEIKPDFILAIDALASRNIDRINKTIQITDTGIHPGSGIGNNRMEISMKTLGIPVIAIGVPTVVLSSTIVFDTIEYLYKHISYIKENENINKLSYYKNNYKDKLKNMNLSNKDKEKLLGLFGLLNDFDRRSLIDEVLNNTQLNLIVTPTEIDFLIGKISDMIASSINNSLHRQITHY